MYGDLIMRQPVRACMRACVCACDGNMAHEVTWFHGRSIS